MIQFPSKSSALTANFRIRQPSNAPFVLYCTPTVPRLPCGCRRRYTGFSPASSWPWPSQIVVLLLCPERDFHLSRPHSVKFHHYVVQQIIVCKQACRSYYHVAEYLVVTVAVQLFHQFGQMNPVYIFRNIRATFHSGVKNDLRPSLGLMLFFTRPKFSAISRRGSNFVSCPIRSFRKLNSRARKN